MANPSPAPADVPAKPRGLLARLIPLVVVAACSVAGGALAPRYFGSMLGKQNSEEHGLPAKQAFVPFGEVVVNLSEERLTRYLRIKLMLVIDGHHLKEHTEKITTAKAKLKSWLIMHLSDKSLKDVSGGAGVNRLRREILEQFNVLLGSEPDMVQDVLFEEFVIQ
jgi:flagellar protein FliL